MRGKNTKGGLSMKIGNDEEWWGKDETIDIKAGGAHSLTIDDENGGTVKIDKLLAEMVKLREENKRLRDDIKKILGR